MTGLITFTAKGIFCPSGGFYVDPWLPVERAVITHAHSDHSRFGSERYMSHHLSVPVIKHRLGAETRVQGIEYGEKISLSDTRVSLHPAGHIPGSAQVRIEADGEVCVISGDYKLEDDGLSTPFEPVPCDTFVTESTFGIPVFRWQRQADVADSIIAWWDRNRANGQCSILLAYSLGKAQRLLNVLGNHGEVLSHGAVFGVNEALRGAGLTLPPSSRILADRSRTSYRDALVLAPPSAMNTPWLKRFRPYSLGCASGWMQIRGMKRRRGIDKGFVVSDHADFEGLLLAVRETGASQVFVTHGYTSVFARYLNEQGVSAHEVKTEFKNNELAEPEAEPDETGAAA